MEPDPNEDEDPYVATANEVAAEALLEAVTADPLGGVSNPVPSAIGPEERTHLDTIFGTYCDDSNTCVCTCTSPVFKGSGSDPGSGHHPRV